MKPLRGLLNGALALPYPPKVSWPADLGPPLPDVDLRAFRDALSSFPSGTGLG